MRNEGFALAAYRRLDSTDGRALLKNNSLKSARRASHDSKIREIAEMSQHLNNLRRESEKFSDVPFKRVRAKKKKKR
jgi:hypothetical protein